MVFAEENNSGKFFCSFSLLENTYRCLSEVRINYRSCCNYSKCASIDQGLKHICPKDGAVFGDKGYCSKEASRTIKRNGCVSKVILKTNMDGEDFERDRRITKQRIQYARNIFFRNVTGLAT